VFEVNVPNLIFSKQLEYIEGSKKENFCWTVLDLSTNLIGFILRKTNSLNEQNGYLFSIRLKDKITYQRKESMIENELIIAQSTEVKQIIQQITDFICSYFKISEMDILSHLKGNSEMAEKSIETDNLAGEYYVSHEMNLANGNLWQKGERSQGRDLGDVGRVDSPRMFAEKTEVQDPETPSSKKNEEYMQPEVSLLISRKDSQPRSIHGISISSQKRISSRDTG
jgi:hypothetical protein